MIMNVPEKIFSVIRGDVFMTFNTDFSTISPLLLHLAHLKPHRAAAKVTTGFH